MEKTRAGNTALYDFCSLVGYYVAWQASLLLSKIELSGWVELAGRGDFWTDSPAIGPQGVRAQPGLQQLVLGGIQSPISWTATT
jgi:hypothetical protein